MNKDAASLILAPGTMRKRKRTSFIFTIPLDKLNELVENSQTFSEILNKMGLNNKGGNVKTLQLRLSEECIDCSRIVQNRYKHLTPRTLNIKSVPLENVLVENSSYSRQRLKYRLIKDGILENKCAICGLLPEWNNKRLVMIIDHINGVYNDNRLHNLRLICPNCNSQTDTFAGRNGKIVNRCIVCNNIVHRRSQKCVKCRNQQQKGGVGRRKVVRPTKEELTVLLWQKPTTHIAKDFGISDKAIHKWALNYNIPKPPRGYWMKVKYNV